MGSSIILKLLPQPSNFTQAGLLRLLLGVSFEQAAPAPKVIVMVVGVVVVVVVVVVVGVVVVVAVVHVG